MPKKQANLDAAVARVAEIIQSHLRTLAPSEAKTMLNEIRVLAVKSRRSLQPSKMAIGGRVKERLILH